MVESLRYKLMIFSVNLEVPEEVYCYKKSMVKKSSVPVSVLNKGHNYICYHRVRETQVDGKLRVRVILGEYNLADLFTNTTMTVNMRNGLVELIFYNKVVLLS